MHTRRDFVKLAATGLAGVAAMKGLGEPTQAATTGKASKGTIRVRTTAGAERFAEGQPLTWEPSEVTPKNEITVSEKRTFQDVLGFGAAFTDAACFNIARLPETNRSALLKELFDPSEMGFNVGRICIGASDYSSHLYSYNDGEPDPELKRFSIEHDRQYILPTLRASRELNPDLFLLASPWSPPGWMKPNGSMLGGSMRKSYFSSYADYLAKFVEQYAAEKVGINAITPQNEVDTDQDGKMPACLWGQEYEMEFVSKHLGPKLAKQSADIKIWILDHNYNLWGRAICELDDPLVNKYVDGIAWHGYAGEASMMSRVHDAYPSKHAYWTEGGPEFIDPDYLSGWTKWSSIFTGVLRNWGRCVIGWNLALDEQGKPNIGPFHCGGVVCVHTNNHEVVRSGQYWAFAHFSRAVRRGARRCDSQGTMAGVSHVCFVNPDGSKALIVTNEGPTRTSFLREAGMRAELKLPESSVTTLTWA